jgi:hypothetical protein
VVNAGGYSQNQQGFSAGGIIFQRKMAWTRSMAHGSAQGVVHGEPTTMASHRAQRSSAEWPLQGAAALPLEGKMEGAM